MRCAEERGVASSYEGNDVRLARRGPNVLLEQESGDRFCVRTPRPHEMRTHCTPSKNQMLVARSPGHVNRARPSKGDAVGRHLHIGIARLNKAISEYSLARLEFTLLHPDLAEPPLIQRVGTHVPDEPVVRNWADTMKRIALLQNYIESTKTADMALQREPSFQRLTKRANHVAVLA